MPLKYLSDVVPSHFVSGTFYWIERFSNFKENDAFPWKQSWMTKNIYIQSELYKIWIGLHVRKLYSTNGGVSG